MDVDTSKQNIQKTQIQPNDFQQMKRQRDPSFQSMNKQQPSFQHMTKQQRMHHLNETDEIRSIFVDSLKNNHDTKLLDCEILHFSIFKYKWILASMVNTLEYVSIILSLDHEIMVNLDHEIIISIKIIK